MTLYQAQVLKAATCRSSWSSPAWKHAAGATLVTRLWTASEWVIRVAFQLGKRTS